MSACRIVQPVSSASCGRCAAVIWRRLMPSPRPAQPAGHRWHSPRLADRHDVQLGGQRGELGVVRVVAGAPLEVEQGGAGVLAVDQGLGHQVAEQPHAVHQCRVAARWTGRPPRRARRCWRRRSAAAAGRPAPTGRPGRPARARPRRTGRRARGPGRRRAAGRPAGWRRHRRAAPRRRRRAASAGSSTYSRTPWQQTRSTLPGSTTWASWAASAWTARIRPTTPASSARRASAASASGLGSTTVTWWPSEASGTARPPVPPPTSSTTSGRAGVGSRAAGPRGAGHDLPDRGGAGGAGDVATAGPAGRVGGRCGHRWPPRGRRARALGRRGPRCRGRRPA